MSEERPVGKSPLFIVPYAPTIQAEAHNLMMSETVGRHMTVRIVARLLDLIERGSPCRAESERDLDKHALYRVSHGSSRFIDQFNRSDQAEELRRARMSGIRAGERIAYYTLAPGQVPADVPLYVAGALERAEKYCSEHGEFERDRKDCPYCFPEEELPPRMG